MTTDLGPDPGPEADSEPAVPAARRPWWHWLALASGLAALGLLLAAGLVRFWLIPQLPSTDSIRELKLAVPLRVYTRDGKLIGEFGAERRAPLRYEEIPARVVQAFLAAEDDRFFEHPGVDWQGLARAVLVVASTGEKSQGGSTITMQVARNVFLSSERTFTRKAKEILLALQIEKDLSKQQILEVYLNKIFLGERAYGVGAAARAYFDKDVKDLTLGETAILAALPKAPSRDNPIASPERAKQRRDYVLRRMRELNFITEQQQKTANAEPVIAREQRPAAEVDAYYVAEMVRNHLAAQYGDAIYDRGQTVVTTLDSRLQATANAALRDAVRDYEERHGWRGPEAKLAPEALAELTLPPDQPRPLSDDVLDERPATVGLVPAIVVDYANDILHVALRDHSVREIKGEDLTWAGKKLAIAAGDVVRVTPVGERLRLTQLPEAQGAFIALDPHDGAVLALAGGYDFFAGKFNRVTQARRQPGSGFKPVLYSAALTRGFTPASVLLDAPVVFDDPALESTWRPENYSGKFNGPTRLREALVESKNLVSIRLLQAVGIEPVRQYAALFGFPEERMPHDLTLALGSPTFTPWEVARAYAVFANGGFRVEPYYIAQIKDDTGKEVFKADPVVACPACDTPPLAPLQTPADLAAAANAPATPAAPASTGNAAAPGTAAPAATAPPPVPMTPDGRKAAVRVMDPRVNYMIRDMMRDVATRGTAAKVHELGRNDLAGKTGTTNDETDAWFNGFQSNIVGISWVGFDQPKPLGRGEVGGRAALPMWMDFMKTALKNMREDWPDRPPGLVTVRIDPDTGKLAPATAGNAVFEIVPADNLPPADSTAPGEEQQQKPEDLY